MRVLRCIHISVLFVLKCLLCAGEQPMLSCQETLSAKLITLPFKCTSEDRLVSCGSTSKSKQQTSEMRMSFRISSESVSLNEIQHSGNITGCIGMNKLERKLSNGVNITIEHYLLYIYTLAVGIIILDTNCWEYGKENCVKGVRLREDIIALPQYVFMPDSPEFWDFSSPLLRAELGWLTHLGVKGFVNKTYPFALKGLAESSIEYVIVDGYFGLDMNGPIPALDHMPHLTGITIANNELIKLRSDTLNGSENIINIQLDKNKLDKIPDYITTFSDLDTLVISSNMNPLFLNTEILKTFVHLSTLSFSGSRIENWPVTLPSLPTLRDLNLTDCGIKFMPSKSFEFPELLRLDLSNNFLSSLPPDVFSRVPKLIELKINNNKITFLSDSTLKHLISIDFIEMGNNNFNKWPVFPSINISLVNLNNNNFVSLVNLGRDGTRILILDVSGNDIQQWDDENVFLTTSDGEEYREQAEITDTVLSINYNTHNNKIKIPWVNTLNISRNNIKLFSGTMLKSFDALEVVDMGGNKIDCGNCENIRLQRWLGNRKTTVYDVGENKTLTCFSPDASNGQLVNQIKFEELCSISKTRFWWNVGTFIVVLVTIVVALCGIAFHYRTELVYLRHLATVRNNSKREDQDSCDSIYDAFVCYSGKNRKWVLRCLAPLLEGPPENYRFCFFDRDFRLGTHIVANIVDAIDQSRKVLLVVSEEFVASKWCQWELEMANHKMFSEDRDFLVLLELDPLERRHLPRLLRFLLDTRPVVRWPRSVTAPRVQAAAATLRKALGTSLSQRERESKAESIRESAPNDETQPFSFADLDRVIES